MSASAMLWGKHRVEALTDGIFAVAMTLLVIDLKLPTGEAFASNIALVAALAALAPKVLSWIISFYVLAIFWISHQRLFHHVRHVDAGLLWRNLNQLAFVALIPFSAALVGEYGWAPAAQITYNANMAALGLAGWFKFSYVRNHPGLASHRIDGPAYHATLLRSGGVIALAAIAIALSLTRAAPYSTLVYLTMLPIAVVARRLERPAVAPPPPDELP